jgi:hypothetical protein
MTTSEKYENRSIDNFYSERVFFPASEYYSLPGDLEHPTWYSDSRNGFRFLGPAVIAQNYKDCFYLCRGFSACLWNGYVPDEKALDSISR